MNDICNSISQCKEYYAEELAAAAAKAPAATPAKNYADFKREDYEAIARGDHIAKPSLAQRFAQTAFEVLNYGLSVPREKAMP